jgi:hypothetical protein
MAQLFFMDLYTYVYIYVIGISAELCCGGVAGAKQVGLSGSVHTGHGRDACTLVALGERVRCTASVALLHGIYLGALWVGALFKVPLKILIWGILIKVPLIYYNLEHFGQTASNSKDFRAF